MIPAIGRIVRYRLGEYDAKEINRRRTEGAGPAHGNQVYVGDVYPMMITRLWTDNPDEHSVVQGQVFLDGDDSLWVTSVKQGDGEREWHKPPMSA